MIEKPITLVYIEDDPGSRKVMTMLVTQLTDPVQLVILEDSEDFIMRVEAIDPAPDVFLIDIHVHPLDGFGMLELLRAHPLYHEKMIVALTASVMNAEIHRLKEAGFDGVLAKPLHFQSFPGTLERILTGERIWKVLR